MQSHSSRRGLTIIEVLIAMVILSLVLMAVAGMVVGSMRQNVTAGGRTASVQLLNYLGRRAAEGDGAVIPAGSARTWDYGALKTSFPDLKNEGSFSDPERYRAQVDNLGAPDWVSASGLALTTYQVSVCWESPDGETCSRTSTVGPVAPPTPNARPLDGLN